ncbi:hypothetical protein DBR00_12145 [Pseudomonas sp. HMWF032]|nr:hypothetical protein DBR00_12145 [Pseudomonas sp. HMWF032]PTT78800.1 hypothetical protein DBR41_22620 [Pseudomonas sp. HMWF010]
MVRAPGVALVGAVYWCVAVGLIVGAVFSASAYPAQAVFIGFGLVVSWLLRFQAPPLGSFDFSLN